MQEDIANLVHSVLNYGLRLKDRLDQGEAPDLDAEQANLRALLLTDAEAKRWADFGAQSAGGDSSVELDRHESNPNPDEDRFLGIRYALVCWLDEFFILYSPWETQWNERKLEGELYGTNDRAWKFWEQAALSLARTRPDALEAYYLCVQLGFRGELNEQIDKLQAWVNTTKTRIAKIRNQEWQYPTEYDPPTFVPAHHGREHLRKMVLTGGIVLLCLIPVVAFFVVRRLGQ